LEQIEFGRLKDEQIFRLPSVGMPAVSLLGYRPASTADGYAKQYPRAYAD
jgi:hypothetical protein